jgi:mannose-6-phosphate isomerase-like protein (cupin superfamily)
MNLPHLVENKALDLLAQGIFRPKAIVEKVWGTEYIVLNESEYCLKIMNLKPGMKCSEHMHPLKKETFIVQEGWLELKTKLDWPDSYMMDAINLDEWRSRVLKPGDKFTIPPKVWHVFLNHSTEACKFIEVSTHDSPDDVMRGEGSGNVESYTS